MKPPIIVKKDFPGFKKGDVFTWRKEKKYYSNRDLGNSINLDIDEVNEEWFEVMKSQNVTIKIQYGDKTKTIKFKTFHHLDDILSDMEMCVIHLKN